MPSKKHIKKIIPELQRRPMQRLGRHLHHDPRSREYKVRDLLDTSVELQSRRWTRHVAAFDQGNLGSCTGNACIGMLATDPFNKKGPERGLKYNEDAAVDLYSLATEIDEFGGTYPPNDTGSSTLGILKAAQQRGYIDSYVWGFGLDDVLRTLSQLGPVIVGTNWYSSMFNPVAKHMLEVNGSVEGGHEYELLAIDVEHHLVEMENSWGKYWGKRGRACMSWDTLARLLSEEGEAGFGVRNV